jgi:hypothetical protein
MRNWKTLAIAGILMLATGPAWAKTAEECNAEYTAQKTAIRDAKEKKADFMAACKATAEGQSTPIGSTAASGAPPAAASAAPGASGSGAPTGANQFATEAEAKAKCGTGAVVWVNLKTKVYHFAGNPTYGATKHGAYMCETDATAAGDRAAKNEKRPG